jgi:hypothetical protein
MTSEERSELWQQELTELLVRAAEMCVDHGVDVDSFVQGAWRAYVAMRPGMREYLEEMELRNQLEELRKAGKIAQG